MSSMGKLVFQIQEMLAEGYSSATIAKSLNIPIEWVEREEETINGPTDPY